MFGFLAWIAEELSDIAELCDEIEDKMEDHHETTR